MAQPPPIEVKQGAPEWMVTFADLMSLLLTFFVLLLSFSTMEDEKFNAATGSIRNAFGQRSEFSPLNKPRGARLLPNKSQNDHLRDGGLDRLVLVKLREAMEQEDLAKHGYVEVTEKGVRLKLDGDVAFEPGQARMTSEVQGFLDRIAHIALSTGGTVEVQGHTDDAPIRSSQYPSNWELSAARASAVVRYLEDREVPRRSLRAVGLADTVPLVPNTTPDNRARNRRVEFLFIKPAGSSLARPTGHEGIQGYQLLLGQKLGLMDSTAEQDADASKTSPAEQAGASTEPDRP